MSFLSGLVNKIYVRTISSLNQRWYLISFYLIIYSVIFIIYFKPLLYSESINFPDLGVFPLYSRQIFEQYFYFWQLGGFGSQGSILSYSVIIYFLEHIFINRSLAESFWIMTFLPIGSLSIFYFSHTRLNINLIYSLIFAFLYAFNPFTVGLFYMGSVNDTLTMYVFLPILITLVFNIFSSKTYLEGIQWSLCFTLMFYYVYSWSPEFIMWVIPFIFISLILWVIENSRSLLRIRVAFFSVFLSIISVLLITGNLQTTLTLLLGHGNNTFIISGGTSNVSDLIINFSENFVGQLSYRYAIICYFVSGLSFLIFLKVKTFLSIEKKNLYLSSTILTFIILFVWTIFRFSFAWLEIMLATYLPEIAAYEPFMGITLLFSLFFIEFLILWDGFTNSIKIHVKRKHRVFQITFLIIITVILLTSGVGYWRQNVPSTADQLIDSNLVFGQYVIPNDYMTISSWLNSHLSGSGGRYILLPYGGMSNEAISTSIPEIPSVSLPYSLWNEILTAGNNSISLQSFSRGLSLLGIEYIVINKGPYVLGDPGSSFIGKARISPAGFPWDLSYLPEGSWVNWSKIFSNDSYLNPVMNQNNWIVFQNTLYVGLFHAYVVPPNFEKSDISSITVNGNLLYYWNGSTIPLNFNIPHQNAFSENWSKSVDVNNTVCYNGGPLPSNMSYSNIWDAVELKNNSYYNLNYSVSGKNMSGAIIFIRFYSEYNLSGNTVATYASPNVNGNLTNMTINYDFKTPSRFQSAAVFLTYTANPHVSFYQYSFRINSFRYENESYPIFKPILGNYGYINPTKISLNLTLPENSTVLILYSSTFNSDWVLNSGNTTYYSMPISLFSNSLYNSFILKGKVSGASVNFELQNSHVIQLIIEWIIIILYVSSFSFIVLLKKVKKTNGKR